MASSAKSPDTPHSPPVSLKPRWIAGCHICCVSAGKPPRLGITITSAQVIQPRQAIKLLPRVAIGVDGCPLAGEQISKGVIDVAIGDGPIRIGEHPHTPLPVLQIVTDGAAPRLSQDLVIAQDITHLRDAVAIRLQDDIPIDGGFIPEVVRNIAAHCLLHPAPGSVVSIAGTGAIGECDAGEPVCRIIAVTGGAAVQGDLRQIAPSVIAGLRPRTRAGQLIQAPTHALYTLSLLLLALLNTLDGF